MRKFSSIITLCLLFSLFIASCFNFIKLSYALEEEGGEVYICCNCGPTCDPKITNCSVSACECQSNHDTPITTQHITDEFILHREWLIKTMWEAHVLPAMMMMTEQISAVAMQQMLIVGTFFDAKHQLETQRLLQEMQAQAHKDYQPSKGMCEFGTNTRSLAASDRNADLTTIAIASHGIQRQLLSGDGMSAGGWGNDKRSRVDQLKSTYCNKADYGNGMGRFCNVTDTQRVNRDLDYTNTIDREKTLNLDFSLTDATADKTDVISLFDNLYAQDLLPHIQEWKIATKDGRTIPDGAYAYMKVRSLAAQRSVAEAAFAAQAAMKSQGTENVQPYMQALLEEMGISETDAIKIVGDRPSYAAQMEMLSKTLYQTPQFYTELYDKPANVDRKIVSMQAIDLMMRRDIYRSNLRREAIEAVWLENELEIMDQEIRNNIGDTLGENRTLSVPGLE